MPQQQQQAVEGHSAAQSSTAVGLFNNIEVDPQHMKRLAEISRQLNMVEELVEAVPEEERSPSPEPIYDNAGTRINTRVWVLQQKLQRERRELVEAHLKQFTIYSGKVSKKVYVPVEEYPSINFFGLIVGARGSTHRRLQELSGCKIEVRGKVGAMTCMGSDTI